LGGGRFHFGGKSEVFGKRLRVFIRPRTLKAGEGSGFHINDAKSNTLNGVGTICNKFRSNRRRAKDRKLSKKTAGGAKGDGGKWKKLLTRPNYRRGPTLVMKNKGPQKEKNEK